MEILPKMKKSFVLTFLLLIIFLLLFSCGGGGGGGAADNDFTITYKANGAESGKAPATQTSIKTSAVALQANNGSLVKNGYLFDGWNTKPDGSGADYIPGTSYKGEDLTLYAKWAAIFFYQIVSPGASSPSLDEVQKVSTSFFATITGLTAKGKTLSDIDIPITIDGYEVASIGGGAFRNCSNLADITIPPTVTSIGANAFYGCTSLATMTLQSTVPPTLGTDALAGCPALINVPTSAVDIYKNTAGWEDHTARIITPETNLFYVNYESNGAESGIVPLQQVGTVGLTLQIYGNTGNMQKYGFYFNGWNTRPDGTGNSFASGSLYVGPGNLTLYAQWYHPPYTVNFNSQGANTPASPESMTILSPKLTVDELPTAPEKDLHYFGGWWTQPGGEGTRFTTETKVAGDITVYAKWNQNPTYTVTFDSQGATTKAIPETKDVIRPAFTIDSLPSDPVKTNYMFGGWYTQPGGAGTLFTAGTQVNADMTVYAKWMGYNVDVGGISNGTVTPDKVGNIVAGETVTLTISADSGYRFGSISVLDSSSMTVATAEVNAGTKYTFIMPASDVTVSAIFNRLYTITYDSNNATGGSAPSAQQGISGEKITVQNNTGSLVRTDYRFGGWNTRADGTGTNYTAGASKYTLETSDVTLYAKWITLYVEKANLEVGDIVLQNKKYVSYATFETYAEECMASSQPAGVVCFKGETGVVGTTGKVYMVGLNQGDNLMWAPSETAGFNTKFSTSQKAGEDNWTVITAADPTGSADAAAKYPAFNYTNTYSVPGYPSGWFLPAMTELSRLYTNRTTINNSIAAITGAGGTAAVLPSFGLFWSSSNSAGASGDNEVLCFGFALGDIESYIKSTLLHTCVVRALDD